MHLALEWVPSEDNAALADAEPEPVELNDGTLVVTVVEASQLKKMDTFGQNDVYCVAAVSGKVRADIIGHACAHQYVGKSQLCMVQNARLIPHASHRR